MDQETEVSALVSISLLIDARVGVDVSGRYRAFTWLVIAAMYLLFTTVGAALGRRSRITT